MAGNESDILAVNGTFYAAFAAGDYATMERLWAQTLPVCCVHPGWPPVHGREKIMAT